MRSIVTRDVAVDAVSHGFGVRSARYVLGDGFGLIGIGGFGAGPVGNVHRGRSR